MLNMRKFVWPLSIIGLLVIFGLNVTNWGVNTSMNVHDVSFYHNMVVIDNFSVAFSALLILLALFIIILSADFYKNEENRISDYLAIIIFTLCGALALVSFGNMAMFFLGIEVLSISLYVLAGSRKKDIRSNEAGMKYFLMGSFASGLLLFGIALIYGERGSFDLSTIANIQAGTQPSVMYYLGAGLIMIALFFKVSAAPFHFWAPDVYDGSPTLVTLVMATIAKIAAFAAFYRLFGGCLVDSMPFYGIIFSAITALTITIGNFTALNQDSFKRMLAFSSISNAGYLLMGIMSISGFSGGGADNAVFYYSLAYGLSSVAAFAIAIAVAKNAGTDKIEAFNGLASRKPWLAAALTIAMLSFAGIPPFAGFFAKYYIFTQAMRTGHLWVTILAVINSIVAVYYYFKVILAMYTKDSGEVVFSIKPTYTFVILVCVALVILIGLQPSWFANLL